MFLLCVLWMMLPQEGWARLGGGASQTTLDTLTLDRLHVNDVLGIGTLTPGSPFDLITGETSASAMHVGEVAGEGLFLTSLSDNAVYFSNAEYVAGSWVARATSAAIMGLEDGTFTVWANASLTDGNPFTPTARLIVAPDGNVGIGASASENNFVIQGASGVGVSSAMFAGDGDGTDTTSWLLYGVGTPGSTSDRERLIIQYDSSGSEFRIRTESQGTGTLRPLVFDTEGNDDQLYLDTHGNIGIGTSSVGNDRLSIELDSGENCLAEEKSWA